MWLVGGLLDFRAIRLDSDANEIILVEYGRSAGHLRLSRLAFPDAPGRIKQGAFFSGDRRRSDSLPHSQQARLFESDSRMEIARYFFEEGTDPARAILLGLAKTQTSASHSPLRYSQCVRLVEHSGSPSLVRS